MKGDCMTVEEKYVYWLELANYDLESADAMFTSGRWYYVVFMCQQSIEKLCKGLYTLYIDDNVPKIHNIKTLVSRFKEKLPFDIKEDTFKFFDTLSAQYITYRYPDFKNKPGSLTDKDEAAGILEKTKEIFLWLLTLKP